MVDGGKRLDKGVKNPGSASSPNGKAIARKTKNLVVIEAQGTPKVACNLLRASILSQQ